MRENIYNLLKESAKLTGRSYKGLKKAYQSLSIKDKIDFKQQLIQTLHKIKQKNDGKEDHS